MKKLIFLILLILSLSSISNAQYYPYIPRYTDIPNTWDSTQRFGHVIIDSSLSLYNLNGNRWLYANGADSSIVIGNGNIYSMLKDTSIYLRSESGFSPNKNIYQGYMKSGGLYLSYKLGSNPTQYSEIISKPEGLSFRSDNGIVFESEVSTQGNILPTTTSTYNLGSTDKKWKNGYFDNLFVDTLTIRSYLLDTGTAITRNLIPQTTRLYNLGGSSNYWLNTYTQNLYVDTVKSTDVHFSGNIRMLNNLFTNHIYPNYTNSYNLGSDSYRFLNTYSRGVITDTLWLGNTKIYKGNGFLNISQPIYLPNTSGHIDWGSGNVRLNNASSYNFIVSQWDGASNDTTLYITGLDSSVKVYGALYPGNDLAQMNGRAANRWINTFSGSLNLGIDSTGAKEDSVYVGRHTLLVNCSNADSNVVWLSDYNVTQGQRYMVKKIDANAINVIVKSKSGYTIDGAISKIWNTQYQTFTFVYKNKTWYIL